jgi:tetratricopeptide (TPR) repeat protein
LVQFILFCVPAAKAQKVDKDSIYRVIAAGNTNDTSKVLLYLRLANLYDQVNADSVRALANKALKLADANKYNKGIAGAYEMIGASFAGKALYDSAIFYFSKALHISKKAGLVELRSSKYNHIANVYFKKAKYARASIYYDSAINASKATGNIELQAKSLSNQANVYYTMGDYTARA